MKEDDLDYEKEIKEKKSEANNMDSNLLSGNKANNPNAGNDDNFMDINDFDDLYGAGGPFRG